MILVVTAFDKENIRITESVCQSKGGYLQVSVLEVSHQYSKISGVLYNVTTMTGSMTRKNAGERRRERDQIC